MSRWWLAILLASCTPTNGRDAALLDGATACTRASDCSDGVFCNGAERCDPDDLDADARGCVTGTPPCETTCSEDGAGCGGCAPADGDGDGHAAIACRGDDCDDADASRHPDRLEVCDARGNDEDCDPETVGSTDVDGDGEVSSVCCNDERCGLDCDDGRPAVGTFATEHCNGRDDDCDGGTDEGVTVLYFADVDGDGFGATEDVRALCAPTGVHRALRDGDCDDGHIEVSPTSPERCNGLDDDCNGNIDDGAASTECIMPGVSAARCEAARCVIDECVGGTADCNADARDGCEADLSSAAHCGTCGTVCLDPRGTAACIAGVCDVTACAHEHHRCDRRCVRQSVASCGASCEPCPPPPLHGTTTCRLVPDLGAYGCAVQCEGSYRLIQRGGETVCAWASAGLATVEVGGAPLSPAFRSDVLSYEVRVPAATEAVQVRAVVAIGAVITVRMGDVTLVSGVPSAPIPLLGEITDLYVDSEAESGAWLRYHLRVLRASEGAP